MNLREIIKNKKDLISSNTPNGETITRDSQKVLRTSNNPLKKKVNWILAIFLVLIIGSIFFLINHKQIPEQVKQSSIITYGFGGGSENIESIVPDGNYIISGDKISKKEGNTKLLVYPHTVTVNNNLAVQYIEVSSDKFYNNVDLVLRFNFEPQQIKLYEYKELTRQTNIIGKYKEEIIGTWDNGSNKINSIYSEEYTPETYYDWVNVNLEKKEEDKIIYYTNINLDKDKKYKLEYLPNIQDTGKWDLALIKDNNYINLLDPFFNFGSGSSWGGFFNTTFGSTRSDGTNLTINYSSSNQLPYLSKGGFYTNSLGTNVNSAFNLTFRSPYNYSQETVNDTGIRYLLTLNESTGNYVDLGTGVSWTATGVFYNNTDCKTANCTTFGSTTSNVERSTIDDNSLEQNDISFEMWVKSNTTDTTQCGADAECIFYSYGLDDTSGLRVGAITNAFRLVLKAGGVLLISSSPAANIMDLKWHHIYWQLGSGTNDIYVDGILIFDGGDSSQIGSDVATFNRIGDWGSHTGGNWQGNIDEPVIRTGASAYLTSGQINANFRRGAGKLIVQTSYSQSNNTGNTGFKNFTVTGINYNISDNSRFVRVDIFLETLNQSITPYLEYFNVSQEPPSNPTISINPTFNITLNTTDVRFNNTRVNISVTFKNTDTTGLSNTSTWYENNNSLFALYLTFDTNNSAPVQDYSGFNNTINMNSLGSSARIIYNNNTKDCLLGRGNCANLADVTSKSGANTEILNITYTQNFNFTNQTGINFTVFSLIKLNSTSKGGDIISQYNSVGNNRVWVLQTAVSGSNINGRFNTYADGLNSRSAVGTTNLASNQWYCLTGRFNGTTTSVYLNGVNEANTASSGVKDTDMGISLSRNVNAGGYNGTLDDTFIIKKAWSNNQILQTCNDLLGNKSVKTLVNNELTAGNTYMVSGTVSNSSTIGTTQNTTEILIIANATPSVPVQNYPVNGFLTANYSISLSCSGSSDPDGDTVYYEYWVEREVSSPTINPINITTNEYNYSIGLDGSYYWRCRATDKNSESGYTSTRQFYVDRRLITENVTIVNQSALYSSKQTLSLNVTFNQSTVNDITSNLIFDGVSYASSVTSFKSNGRLFTNTRSISSVSPKSWTWNLTETRVNSTINYNSTYLGNMSVTDIDFALCNSSLTSPVFLNLTFKDESTNANINASIEASTFGFYVDDEAYKKSFSFINTTQNFNYAFCGVPSYTYLNLNISSFNYKSGTIYPQRTYAKNLIISNASTNRTLYLLPTTSGTYVTFQVVTPSNSPIQDVYVTAESGCSSSCVLSEAKYTDAAGASTFFVNPDTSYKFTFSKVGYVTYSTTLNPTQASYTVTLSTTSTTTQTNLARGIEYTILPSNSTLNNNTNYLFSFNLVSNFNSISSYGFVLTNSSSYQLGSASASTNGGTVSTTISTGNESQILMNYFWVINSTYSNGTKTWDVFEQYQGKYSVLSLCLDMQKLSTKSVFGTGGQFTLALVAFFIILFIVGAVSYYSGVYSPVAISAIVMLGTSFFDFCGSWIPQIGIVPHFISIVVTLIFVGVVIDENINSK